MKIEKETTVSLNTLKGAQTKFTIDEDGADFIIEALSKTIYKNPIGTIIREYTSNGWDANREANSDDPVFVSLDKDPNGIYVSFLDYGVGLSSERINNIFCRYGKSTKRGDNNQIGGFGIGAKSGFAYTDTFFINTVHENVLYKYILYKTEKVPQIQLLTHEEVDQRNSTQIRIYLKDNDLSKFRNEIVTQLRYFDSVFVQDNLAENSYEKINNFSTCIIKDFETFKYSTYNSSNNNLSNLHICLGKVTYPIDFNLIGIPTIRYPFALKFDIGELEVTLSREELQYESKTITAIKNKIALFKEELEKIYLETNKFEYNNLFEREKFERNNPSIIIEETPFSLNNFVKHKESTYEISKDYFVPVSSINNFEIKGLCREHGNIEKYHSSILNFNVLEEKRRKILLDVNRTNKEKNIFFYREIKESFYLIQLRKFKYAEYKKILKLSPKNLGNFKRILDYRNQLLNDINLTKYTEIEISKTYKDAIKAELKLIRDHKKDLLIKELEAKKLKGDMPCYIYNNYSYKKKPSKSSLNLKKNRKSIVWIEHVDYTKMTDFLKKHPILLELYNFISIDLKDSAYISDKFIHFSKLGSYIKSNSTVIQILTICQITKTSIYKKISSSDFRNPTLIKDKSYYLTNFPKMYAIMYSLNVYPYDYTLKNLYERKDEFKLLAKELNIKDYLDTQSLIEIRKSNIISKMIPLLEFTNHYSVELHKTLMSELSKRGLLPGKNSYQPIANWEFELIESSKLKEKYLNEISL